MLQLKFAGAGDCGVRAEAESHRNASVLLDRGRADLTHVSDGLSSLWLGFSGTSGCALTSATLRTHAGAALADLLAAPPAVAGVGDARRALCCGARWWREAGRLVVQPPSSREVLWLRVKTSLSSPPLVAEPTETACGECGPSSAAAREDVVVFSRVPQCGSEALERVFRNERGAARGFHFHRSDAAAHHALDFAGQKSLVDQVRGLATRRRRLVYSREMMYVDFGRHGAPLPVYVGLLRDPLAVQVDAYYAWRDCACQTHGQECRGYHQPASAAACTLSIDDAYAGRAPPRPSIGVLTRFFCGQTAICTAAEPAEAAERDAAYRRAAYNLRHRYAAVAVLERFGDSLLLLRRRLPAYFGALDVDAARRDHERAAAAAEWHRNASAHRQPAASRATLQKLALENENDIRLYRYASRLLDCQLRRCDEVKAERAALAALPPETPRKRRRRDKFDLATIANKAAERLLGRGILA